MDGNGAYFPRLPGLFHLFQRDNPASLRYPNITSGSPYVDLRAILVAGR